MPQFMSALRACPQLQVLRLDNSGPRFFPERHCPLETVVLPALRSFHWVNPSGFPLTEALLRGIAAQRTVRFLLYVTISDELEGLVREGEELVFVENVPLCQAISSIARTLALSENRLTLAVNRHILEYDSDTADRITIYFPLAACEHDSRSLLSNLAHCALYQVQSIALIDMGMDNTDLLVQLLCALPNVTALSLEYCTCDEGLIRALTDPHGVHQIEAVSFSHSEIQPETIISLAQSRATDPENSTDVTPLRHLSFEECAFISDETLESLRALVSEVVQL
ncbi:hypothetical protein BOTBODRAFT_407022 [Botryobasidium botryosum FD-172 SS1]|uniref:F-box domain-containing protein n=1 Tax=Botryobasidium botryosum (strain FD-172 SS1) TaxID=930990 RepID=A0A067MB38_BOTB1|nr:hypothetical protein BOTBODRAFT_407022 [Botryobasidium botryosum FD-172 SS1]